MESKEFSIKNLDEYYFDIVSKFKNVFSGEGYKEHLPNSLISDVDHSVRFIGSTTNVFKPYIINKEIPESGFFLVQKCLRTRNEKTFFKDDIFPVWSSYFTAIGAISKPEKLNNIALDTFKFINTFGIEDGRFLIRISSLDKDLINCVKKTANGINIEVDGENNLSYYRHKYGLNGVGGRNFNLSIRNELTGKFGDIGNIILIEENNVPIAAEVGFGVGTIISKIYNLNNSIESSKISKIITFQEGLMSKFADALSGSIVMLKEGVRPGSRDKERLLRTYLYAVCYFIKKLSISIEDVLCYSLEYEIEEFGESSEIPYILEAYVRQYRNHLIF